MLECASWASLNVARVYWPPAVRELEERRLNLGGLPFVDEDRSSGGMTSVEELPALGLTGACLRDQGLAEGVMTGDQELVPRAQALE